MAPVERGTGLYDGRNIAFEVLDGWAIVEGDIIIGRADDLTRAFASPRRSSAQDVDDRLPVGLVAARRFGAFEVPYTIAADPNGNVPPAIAAFNAPFAGSCSSCRARRRSITSSSRWTCRERAGLLVRARARRRQAGARRSGGRAHRTLLHEMGHAIGLHHEQNRPDRELYVAWQPQNVAKNARSQSALTTFNRKAVAPYDFGSLMHYGDFDFSANGQPLTRRFRRHRDRARQGLFAAPTSTPCAPLWRGAHHRDDHELAARPQPRHRRHRRHDTPRRTPGRSAPSTPSTLRPPRSSWDAAPYIFGRWNVDLVGDLAARRTIRVDAGSGGIGAPASAPAVTVYRPTSCASTPSRPTSWATRRSGLRDVDF
jgi:hypothetical protein